MPLRLKCSYLYRGFLPLAFFTLFLACEKPTDDLGFSQVIGETIDGDTLHLPLVTYTRRIDSILMALPYQTQTNSSLFDGYRSVKLLGRNQSNYFGQSQANIVAEILPLQVNPDFGDQAQIDSVSLFLRLNGSYGDTGQSMDLEVYELGENLSKDSTFFSSFEPSLGSLLGTRENYAPKPNSSGSFEGETAPPLLRIPLDNDYFQSRFAQVGDGAFEPFSSLASFLEYFKGIYITSTAGKAILSVNLNSSFSAMRIHYHNTTDTSVVELNFSANRSLEPIAFSTFNHDYSTSQINLANQDTINGEPLTYVQAMGGVATAFKLNTQRIDSLSKEGLVINRALLELNTAVGTGEAVEPISRLEVREFLGNGLGSRAVDFTSDNGGDGNLRLGALRNNRYRFDLTRQLFAMLNEGNTNALAVVPSNRSRVANRTILEGSESGNKPATLIVYYTQP
jgi:hypothetical protein